MTNPSKFYVMCFDPSFRWAYYGRRQNGFATLEEAKENFHKIREEIQGIHSDCYKPTSKWVIVQTVLDIPIISPPEYSFEPLQLTSPNTENFPLDDEIPF